MSETLLCQPAASHFVDGLAREDNAGTVLLSVNPATGAVIASLHSATPQIIADAVASARRAQAGWAGLPLVERGRVLQRAAAIMRARNRELSVLEARDTGKPLSETLVATPKVCTGSPAKQQPKICGAQRRGAYHSRQPDVLNPDVMRVQQPFRHRRPAA